MGTTISFNRPDVKTLSGYLAEPASVVGAAALVVIQEWWGVNDQIRGVAERLARAGYRALVPDLYRGKSTVEAEEAHHLMSDLNFGDAASEDIRGAAQYLKASGGKVGITGYCMGGALTLLALGACPEADAGVVWYGCPPLEYIDATKIRVPVQGHWATQDEFFPIATVDNLEAKLREAHVAFDFHAILRITHSPTKPRSGRAASRPPNTMQFGRSLRGIGLSDFWGVTWVEIKLNRALSDSNMRLS